MDLETINIPAYQRKRSLAAKSRYAKFTTQRHTTEKPTPIQTRKPVITTRNIRPKFTQTNPRFTQTIPLTENVTADPEENFEYKKEVREMKICGKCEGYFDNIDVAIIKVTSPIRTGDSIIFEKENGLFEQQIESMQINRKNVSLAKSGSDIGIKVEMKPKVGTSVYKVI